ncbi:hypothetical protein GmHk_09G025609 [Glycine max]|nr:hypothetical protein GmHk_09G025609 [Glycine max]
MAPPKEIATIIYHNGHIVDDPVQGSMYTCTTPIFFYVSRSITFTQFIRKINNRLPTRATEQVAQLLFRVPISFHLGQTRFISAQLFDNDDLRGAMETILQNSQLNYVKFYAITELIRQPQPSCPQLSCPQLQLPPPQQLLYNNIDLNNPVSSYNNLESQDPFDIYASYTQILSENDSFLHGQQTSFDQQNHLKKPLMLAGYACTEKMHWRHLGDIRANKPSAAEWLDQLPKQKWVQCFDEGKRWGHMTTNLSESVNSMFKNTRHLSVSSLAQLVANRGRQTQAMINSGSQYSEVVFDAMNSGQQEFNTHIVNEFDKHNHTFIITETQSPLETPRPPGRFRVMLQSQKCDCGEYQAKHLSCSHVMATCKSVNVDPMTYVPMLFTLQHILHIYDNSFGLLPYESMWQEYEADQWGHDPRRKRIAKGRLVQLAFPLRWTKTKMNEQVEKNVDFVV